MSEAFDCAHRSVIGRFGEALVQALPEYEIFGGTAPLGLKGAEL